MKNKIKVFVIIIVLLIVALGVVGTLFLIDKMSSRIENTHENVIINSEDPSLSSKLENRYENIRIISEDHSCGTPSRIIYNNKEYEISEEDAISSIKYYNGKIYFYKSIGEIDICSYMQAVNDIENTKSIFYEFGEIILDEENLTYSMKVEKQISYKEYENGDKSKIEYSIKNSNGEYGLEIFDLIETIEDITILKKYSGTEYYIEFTKKDENNNVKWRYNTECAIEQQYEVIGILDFTDDSIYINENGTIVALNKENGKIIWKSDACKETGGAFDSVYLDKNQNLYIYRGNVTVIDKDGKKRTEIFVPSTDGVGFEYIADEELLISGAFGYAIINSSTYCIEESLSLNLFEEDILIEKKDGNDKVIWKYELKDNTEYDLISSDWKYYIENKIILLHEVGIITALDLETGKVLWKNSDFKGLSFSNTIFDSKNNIYTSINEGPDLCIIDKNGKTIKKVEHFDVEDKIGVDETRTMYVVKFRNNEKELVMEYKNVSGEYLIVNLEDYSITYENIEE